MSKQIRALVSSECIRDDDVDSLGALGDKATRALCGALGIGAEGQVAALSLFGSVSQCWGQSRLAAGPPFENDITDDGTPFEFSVGFESETPELRLLFESQLADEAHSLRSSWKAGLSFQQQLRQSSLIDTTRFDLVRSLFEPTSGQATSAGRFALWHAAALRGGGPALYKAYVSPEIRGSEAAFSVVSEAFSRLGISECSSFLRQRLAHDTRIPYFSLDLEASRHARAKVYLSATDAGAVEALVQGSANYRPNTASGWLKTLAPDGRPFSQRPILVCLAFSGNDPAPNATVHVPIRMCVDSDEEALERSAPLLSEKSSRQLALAMRALTARPLAESKGVLTYVSLRPVGDRVRVTTYLAPCAYSASRARVSESATFAKVVSKR